MHLDVLDLRNFYYRSALGRAAQKAMRDRLVRCGRRRRGRRSPASVLRCRCCGPIFADARRVIGLMPGPQGVMPWPAGLPNVSVLCEETLWPLPTGIVDKLVVMHGLETSEHPPACWTSAPRAGAGGAGDVHRAEPGGAVVAADRTPFGYGRPYSPSQLEASCAAMISSPSGTGPRSISRRRTSRSGCAWRACWTGGAPTPRAGRRRADRRGLQAASPAAWACAKRCATAEGAGGDARAGPHAGLRRGPGDAAARRWQSA